MGGSDYDFRRNIQYQIGPKIPGSKLDMPRLDAPRGPARGRARANQPNLRGLIYTLHL